MKLPSLPPFAKNVLVLMTGTTIAQALPVIASPILTRLYTPAEFGVFAVFMAIVIILSSVVTGRYELAIVLPEHDDDAYHVAALGVLIGIGLSVVTGIASIFGAGPLSSALGHSSLRIWLYIAPAVVLILGIFNVLTYLNIRFENYPDISRSNIYKAVAMTAIQLAVGFIKPGAGGLIGGYALSGAVANTTLAKNSLLPRSRLPKFRLQGLAEVARRYRQFPIYSTGSILAFNLSTHLTGILISATYSVATFGQYALVQRVLGMPSALISSTVGQVYLKEATAEFHRDRQTLKTFRSTSWRLLQLSVPTFLIVFLLSDHAFALIFGEPWRPAGRYAQLLVPLFATRFVVSAVSVTLSIHNRQQISLLWQLGLLAVAIGSIGIAAVFGWSITTFILVFSISATCHYLLLWAVLYKIALGEKAQ